MQLKLIQILDFLHGRSFSLYYRLSRRVTVDKPLVNSVKNCPFQLMVKVHGGLALMVNRLVVKKLLISDSVEVSKHKVGYKFSYPGYRHVIFIQSDFSNSPFFIDLDPFFIVITE